MIKEVLIVMNKEVLIVMIKEVLIVMIKEVLIVMINSIASWFTIMLTILEDYAYKWQLKLHAYQ